MRFYRPLPLLHVDDFSRVNTRLAVFATCLSRLRVQYNSYTHAALLAWAAIDTLEQQRLLLYDEEM